MKRYVIKRFLTGILVVLVSVCINFVLIRSAPGNPVRILAGVDNPNPAQIEALTIKYGLDKSLPEQFVSFIVNVCKGDFGYSYANERPVLELIAEKLMPTLLLSLAALLIAVLFGTLLGIRSARKSGGIFDRLMCTISYFFDSTPSFWLGLMMILIFASRLGWFPTSGMVNMRGGYTGWRYVADVAYHMVLTVGTLALVQFPYYFRIARSSVLQVMSEDFITTLRATGMKESRIFNKYVLRNALIPTVTVLGSSLAFLLAGSVYIETVFSWPGMGTLLFTSISKRDYPLLSGIYLILAITVAAMMIIVDLVYSLIDPRIKYD